MFYVTEVLWMSYKLDNANVQLFWRLIIEQSFNNVNVNGWWTFSFSYSWLLKSNNKILPPSVTNQRVSSLSWAWKTRKTFSSQQIFIAQARLLLYEKNSKMNFHFISVSFSKKKIFFFSFSTVFMFFRKYEFFMALYSSLSYNACDEHFVSLSPTRKFF